ncbi:putative quinol monooxygenase [Aspergillus lucknowensis]|uniref:ABM domain-containing protein n=1 Tax=Aspergillus lucknowensis TaxID=176173 RepID=A0ABR4LL47_9EURO
MYVIAPLSNCASPEKRDRFLEYISKIAPVTSKIEAKCHGYAWFRNAEDNAAVPHHWLRGFEIYEDIAANVETHRASPEYKAFRRAVGAEGLLERPSDLRFWRPLLGYLVYQGKPVDFSASTTRKYIVTDELTPLPGQKVQVIGQLRLLAHEAEQRQVPSFWVLHRGDEEQDESILVFAMYKDWDEFTDIEHSREIEGCWSKLHGLCAEKRRTTWVECGLGFLGR